MERIIEDGSNVNLIHDFEAARKFLDVLGQGRPQHTFQLFDDQKRGRVHPRILHGSLDEHWKTLIEQNALGAGIYTMIQPGDGQGREEANVIGWEWLFLDLDGAPIKAVLEADLKPHLIILTSKKDGKKRFQCLYMVERVEVNNQNRSQIKARLTTFQIALARRFGGDEKVAKDLCRVCRVPGFFHQKRTPSTVELVKVFDHPSYTVEQLQEWLDVNDDVQDQTSPTGGPPSVTIKVIEGRRNDHLFKYGSGKAAQGLSFDEILILTWSKNLDECDPPLSESEVRDIVKSAAKYAAEYGLSGKEFIPKLYTVAIRDKWDIIHYQGRHYRYDAGVYIPWEDVEIKKLVLDWSNQNAKVSDMENLVKRLQIETYIKSDEVNPVGFLNIKNGILDPETGLIMPHSPNIRFTIQLPVKCETPPVDDNSRLPNCPLFMKFLTEVLQDPKQRELIWEIIGYILTTDCRYEKGFILFGGGANGKTAFLNILRALFIGYISELRLSDLSHPYRPSMLADKLVNITSEGEAVDLINDAAVKDLITGEPITVEQKYKDPAVIKTFAKLVVASNHLPRTRDKTHGYFRKWILLHFDQMIPPDRQDKQLAEKIIATELDEIFYGALLGLRRLRQNDGFTLPVSSIELMAEYERTMNPVISFVEDELAIAERGKTYLEDLFGHYKNWAESQGLKNALNQQNLRRELERLTGIKASRLHGGKYGFSGLIHVQSEQRVENLEKVRKRFRIVGRDEKE